MASRLTVDSLAWLSAAALLGDWPEAFTAFLEVYQTIDKHCSTSTGVGRAFGLLLRDADRLERLGYPGPAETLREYLVKHYHRGHLTGKAILFRAAHHRRKLTQRPWISQTGAAELLGVRPPTVADLVRRGVLAGKITEAGHSGRTVGVVARRSVEELRRRMADSLTTKEAAMQLGVERHRVLEFIEVGVLVDAVRTAQGWRISQRIRRRIALFTSSFRTIASQSHGMDFSARCDTSFRRTRLEPRPHCRAASRRPAWCPPNSERFLVARSLSGLR